MTWFTPTLLTRDESSGHVGLDSWSSWPASGGMGSAVAGGWSWARGRATSARAAITPPDPELTPAGVRLRAPREILARMAEAAGALGRSESDIWVEAAREWLIRHEPDGSTGGPRLAATAFSANGQRARRSRAWRDIDGVLERLRDTPHDTEHESARVRRGEPGAA